MVPVGMFVGNSFPIVSAYAGEYIHIKIIHLFSMVCILGCYSILYFLDDFYFVLVAMVLHGFASGSMYYQGMKNCWCFFPKNHGLISGIFTSCFGFSSFIFTLFADYIINPENISANKAGIFPPEVSKNVPKFIFIILMLFSSFAVISTCLLFQHEREKVNEELKEEPEESKEEDEEKTQLLVSESQPICQVLKSLRYHIICVIVFFVGFYGLLVTNTNRGFGVIMEIDIKMLKVVSPACSALNAVSRAVWGLIYDCLGFFYPYVIVCVVQILCSSTLYFSGKNSIAYLIVSLASIVPFSGQTTIFPALISQTFGIKNSTFLIGIISCYTSVAAVLGPTFCNLLIREEHKEDYLKVFLIGTVFTSVAFILLFFVGEEKFKYVNEEETPCPDCGGGLIPEDTEEAAPQET